MTDVLVPDTTAPTTPGVLGAVVRLKVGRVGVLEGERGIICAVRQTGRYIWQVVVPGYPVLFWVKPEEVEILREPTDVKGVLGSV